MALVATLPLSYEAGRRPNIAVVGQLAGSSTSAPDIVVGHTSYNFGNWVDNLGWEGQYDYVTVVEMDSKDIAVTGIDINPVDRFFGAVGEGTRDINVTITNTGMDTLTQSATLDVVLQVVDEANSSNSTVFTHDFDTLLMQLDVTVVVRGRLMSTSTNPHTGFLRPTILLVEAMETTLRTFLRTIRTQPTSCGLVNTRPTAVETNGQDMAVTGMMHLP